MRGNVRDKIKAELDRDPLQRNADLARKLGVRPSYVSTVRQRHGYPLMGNARFSLDNENSEFIRKEADRHGVTPTQILNAIITDARLDEVES